MQGFNENVINSITWELAVIWAAHKAVGLSGQMALYTLAGQDCLRAKEAGIIFWFGENDTDAAIKEIEKYYNGGQLPNSPLLLNPLVHDGDHKPLGSGLMWGTGVAVGVELMKPDQKERLEALGVFTGYMERGAVAKAGVKMVAFSKKALPPLENNITVAGCREMCALGQFQQLVEYFLIYICFPVFRI